MHTDDTIIITMTHTPNDSNKALFYINTAQYKYTYIVQGYHIIYFVNKVHTVDSVVTIQKLIQFD